MGIPTFLVEENGQERRWLRRHAEGNCTDGYHNAMVYLDDAPVSPSNQWDKNDSRWPTKCDKCDYEFTDDDPKYLFKVGLYIRPDTGEVGHVHPNEQLEGRFGPGCIYRMPWLENNQAFCGPDGKSYACILPDGSDWYMDGLSANCTRPGKIHNCWVRHILPDGRFHVDKAGNTCQAGAGSIATPHWHGFLHNGELTPA